VGRYTCLQMVGATPIAEKSITILIYRERNRLITASK